MSNFQQKTLLTTPEDIYGVLRRLALIGQPVNLSIDGTDETFTAMLPNADFKSRSFFIDRILPFHGSDLIRAGKRFSISSNSGGIQTHFRMTGRLKFQPTKNLFRAEFPDSVHYVQRRNAFRVHVPSAHEVRVLLHMNDDEGNLTGTIIDLSSSGFKVRFKGNVKKRIEEQRLFQIARIRFDPKHEMDCSLKAHHMTLTDKKDTVGGFEFMSISPAAQLYIDQLITALQWEERARRDQSYESSSEKVDRSSSENDDRPSN